MSLPDRTRITPGLICSLLLFGIFELSRAFYCILKFNHRLRIVGLFQAAELFDDDAVVQGNPLMVLTVCVLVGTVGSQTFL